MSVEADVRRVIRLPESVKAWGSPDFNEVLKDEIEHLDPALLPLQQGLTFTSQALDGEFSVMVISAAGQPGFIHARVGIFYEGILGGCNCADDPTPVEPQNEYCEAVLVIDRATAEASIALAGD
jgi:hypothetical protein